MLSTSVLAIASTGAIAVDRLATIVGRQATTAGRQVAIAGTGVVEEVGLISQVGYFLRPSSCRCKHRYNRHR